MRLKITWIGHSCFRIEKNGYSVVTDPYEDGYVPGITRPVREKADKVLCSHDHHDHGYREAVEIVDSGAEPFKVTRIETYHDGSKGAERGSNTIHIMSDGIERVAHLGDLGCELEAGQIEALEGIDVMLIPVGGYYTIDGAQAAELVKRTRPALVIPMHYRDPEYGFGFDPISEVTCFTDLMDDVHFTGKSVIDTEKDRLSGTAVMVPRNL